MPQAMLEAHHDDPPCDEKLVSGYCPSCKLTPDMQSIALHAYCPACRVRLEQMECPKCR